MTNFLSRIICAVPAVVVLLSVFWFRRRKKFKAISDTDMNEQTTFSFEESKLTQSGECSLDAADTLSDASSFTSPESSEKSMRTKSIQLMTSSKDNATVNNSISCSTSTVISNCIETNSCEVSPSVKSDNLLYKSNDIQISDVLNTINSVIYDSNNESEKKKSINKGSIEAPEKYQEESLANDINRLTVSGIDIRREINKSEAKNYHSNTEGTTEVLLKMMNSYQNKEHTVENGSLHSIDSNESAISSQCGDMEKLQTIETDSNDSHSSVLDENSLSYNSDDSEYKHLVEIKNKDSLSSVLDENSALSSFCDDSEKSVNVESLADITFKSDIDGDNKNSNVIDDKTVTVINTNMDFSLSSVIEPIAQVENLIDKTQVSNTIENECSNSLGIDKEAHNVKINLPETRDSLDDSAFQNLPIKSTDKFPELNSCSNQRHLTSPTCSNEALASCDSGISESNFIPSSSENSLPKSPVTVSNTVSNDLSIISSLENPILIEKTDENSHIVYVPENGVQVPGTNANCVTAATANPEPATLHIAELLNNPGVTSSENIEGSLNLEDWPSADTQNGIIEDKNEEFCMTGDKPDDPRSQFIYEFELPQELCGRLIGKHGKHVKSIKDRSNANVYIKRHPFDPQLKIVVVEGSYTDVNEALGLIRRKYPLTRYPTVTLEKTNIPPTSILPETLQLHLPAAVSCDVILSSLVNAGHFFLQQPTHPTYPSLSSLDRFMIECYSQLDTPLLPHPVEPGVICAAPVLNGWYRAQVIYVYENEIDCELKFVDYGGFSQAPISSLRQIRSDFMSLPFQASECYLANVRPIDPVEGWSAEATSTFEQLAQGQFLQALLVEYAADGLPCVHLYRVQGVTNVFINKELVERGLAVWVSTTDPH